MITFAFFVGYTSMTLPMGIAAQRFGGKGPIMLALAVNGVVSIFTPWIPLVVSVVLYSFIYLCTHKLTEDTTF